MDLRVFLLIFSRLPRDTTSLCVWSYPPRGSDHMRLYTQVRSAGSCQPLPASLMNSSRLIDRRVTGRCSGDWLDARPMERHTHTHTQDVRRCRYVKGHVGGGLWRVYVTDVCVVEEREDVCFFTTPVCVCEVLSMVGISNSHHRGYFCSCHGLRAKIVECSSAMMGKYTFLRRRNKST